MGRRFMSLWLLMLVLLVSPTSSSPSDKTIRIGHLLHRLSSAGAIGVAIEQAHSDGLLQDYNIRYRHLHCGQTLLKM